jgi:hypothetical protein
MLIVWPAKLLMFTDWVVKLAASVVAAPSSWNTWPDVLDPTIVTRKKSALDELFRCAR